MKEESIEVKRNNSCHEIVVAIDKIIYKRFQLRENLENINKILRSMKKRKKIISSLTYLKLNWTNSIDYEEQLKMAERSLKAYSTCYKTMILERKLLKNEFKQAQRILAKKQKRMKAFNEKYFPRKD